MIHSTCVDGLKSLDGFGSIHILGIGYIYPIPNAKLLGFLVRSANFAVTVYKCILALRLS